jgi:site-specific DNA recombinase
MTSTEETTKRILLLAAEQRSADQSARARTAPEVLRGVIYKRLSPHDPTTKVMTVEQQGALLRAQGEADGMTIVGEFTDDQKSAYIEEKAFNRPGFQALCEAIVAGDCDVVLTQAPDRISRITEQRAAFNSLCAKHGVTVVYEGGRSVDMADPGSRAIANIEGAISEMESAIKSARMRRAFKVKREKGVAWNSGVRPFGYADDRVSLHPTEGPVYRELFDRVIGGESLLQIARDWATRGIVNRNGKRFATTSMVKLVQAPRAIGMTSHNGQAISRGEWTPIVDAETQARAIAALRARRSRTMRSGTAPKRQARLLSSLIVCAQCGHTMRVWNQEGRRTRYICAVDSAGHCGVGKVFADDAETVVEKRLLLRLSDPETLAALAKLHEDRPDVQDILDRVSLHEDELIVLAGEKDMPVREKLLYRKQIQANLDDAQAALDDATRVPAVLALDPEQVLADWGEMSIDDRRMVIVAFIDRVLAHADKRVECEWRDL